MIRSYREALEALTPAEDPDGFIAALRIVPSAGAATPLSEQKLVVPNVHDFMVRACDLYSEWSARRFHVELHRDCTEGEMESPIEQLFWIALRLLCVAWDVDFNPAPEYDDKTGDAAHGPGLYIRPQVEIGSYRVDFLLLHECRANPPPVIVELDGHDFHEKNSKQRSYEKARDRYFVKQGYRVLHYTGSDVVADPLAVAHEVLQLLGATDDEPYRPADPLGMGI